MFDVKNGLTLNLILSSIPETWNDVSEFANWWCSVGMPMLPPKNMEIYLTDDATSFCLFRKGRFQVELYLIHPDPNLQEHGHPGVEVIKMRIPEITFDESGNIILPNNWGMMSDVLYDGERHLQKGKYMIENKGFPLLAFQHWKNCEPSTVAAAWEGETVGPMHEALIKRFFPNAFIERGYADISKPYNYRELLKERT